MNETAARACYVHIPFCERKCAYCDFNSYSGYSDGLVSRYVQALKSEIQSARDVVPLDTIFFGGGTPTAIPAILQSSLLKSIFEKFPCTDGIEITTEANPGSSDIVGLEILRSAGFNRISIGVQSFDDGLLKSLDRIHSAIEAIKAIEKAKMAGFDNISLDLMFGLPNQTVEQWKETLEIGLSLGVQHISLYNLIVEDGTGFATLAKKGRLSLPDNDTMADMYKLAIDLSSIAGFDQYEISNFAQPGRECKHNMHYWQNDPYYGFGAGAVSYTHGMRATNLKRPIAYCKAVESRSALSEDVDDSPIDVRMSETMMLGLRLTQQGVSLQHFRDRYQIDPHVRWAEQIQRNSDNGLLDITEDRLLLTERGIFMANDVMAEFL